MWLAFTVTARAATWTVPVDVGTIDDAVAIANDGDMIRIEPGLYAEHVHVAGKRLTFQGEAGVTWEASGGDALECDSGANCTVRDIAFDGGGQHRALYAGSGTQLEVERCTFVDGSAGTGGAIRGDAASEVVIRDCTFDGNEATSSGGHVYTSGVPTVEITGCTMQGGTAAVDGGAVRITSAITVVLADLWVEGNSALDDGGGIDIDSTSEVDLRRSFFCANHANDEGGGIVVRTADLTAVGNVWLGNEARSGGGLLSTGQTETTNNDFVANTVALEGAAVDNEDGHSTNDVFAYQEGAVAYHDLQGILAYAVVWSNLDGDTDAGAIVNVSFVDPQLGAPPFPCDPVLFQPPAGSPLIDAGDQSLSDVDGSRSDIGAFGGPDPYPTVDVDLDGDGFEASADCDDADPAVNPGAAEVCNGADDDCSGSVPADELDVDADGWLICGGDCDDGATGVNPDVAEVGCNAIDDDCDPDTSDVGDGDHDGVEVCDGDCDDADPAVYPGAAEQVADEVDQDCDGREECRPDTDGDGHGEPGTVISDDRDCQDAGEALHVDDLCVGFDDAIDPDGDGVPTGCEGPDEGLPDYDGDGVPDTIDAAPDDAGGESVAPPAPDFGCGCSTGSTEGSPMLLFVALAWRRRRR